jgi:Zn-dependent peptidase ImmA (M78 family)/DNA-binding XRE family transcriptional regulator
MTEIIQALVNPETLIWAREQAGLTVEEAAWRVGVSSERLISWEVGKSVPTIRQARLLGKAYHRPTAFFYLSSSPSPPKELTDFRRIPIEEARKPPALIYEIRRARFRRQTVVDIFSELDEHPPRFDLSVSLEDDPASIGNRIREYLRVDTESQFGWRDQYEALRAWIDVAEQRGILVFQFSDVEVEIARGFSISERPFPVISLNAKDAPRARIFTLLHECCHLAINHGGLCDLHEEDGGFSVESFCNAAAAEGLVPRRPLLSQPEVEDNPDEPEWSDDRIRALSNRFMVSREVILRRLLTLGRTSQMFYQQKREEYLEEYERLREQRGGFLQYHKRVLRDNGAAFTSCLLDAYRQGIVTAIDLSRYLGDVRLSYVDAIEHELVR